MLGGRSEYIDSPIEVVFLGFFEGTEFYLTLIDFDESAVFLLTGRLILTVLDVHIPDSEASSVVSTF